MKNIHILPTDKPSRLHFTEFFEELVFTPKYEKLDGVNIYITSSNADINENDYIITKDVKLVQVSYLLSKDLEGASKIILTTDQDLIKDGVQSIPDEFLEWFVKNPSCEWVETYSLGITDGVTSHHYKYEIIIPKEEPDYTALLQPVGTKQETLEEVAERLYPTTIDSFTDTGIDMSETERLIFVNGAKWQQERMYSEEDMAESFMACWKANVPEGFECKLSFNEWFEQFKNK